MTGNCNKKGRKARPETYIRIDDLRDQEKELGEEDCTWEMC